MVKLLLKWLIKAYSILWAKFKNREFNYKETFHILHNNKIITIVLSHLKKSTWLDVRLRPEDLRKRMYKLINPVETIKEIVKG